MKKLTTLLTGFIAGIAFIVSCGGGSGSSSSSSGPNSANAQETSEPIEQRVCRSRFSSPVTPVSQVDYCFDTNGNYYGDTLLTIGDLLADGWRFAAGGPGVTFYR